MKQNETLLKLVVATTLGSLLVGCAGPATPFGQLKFWSKSAKLQNSATSDPKVHIALNPGTQRFHHLNQFSIDLTDDRGIPKDASLNIFYNGREVSDAFTIERNSNSKSLTAKFKNLRLNPRKLHNLIVQYHAPQEKILVTKEWRMPSCAVTTPQSILQTADFEVDPKMLMKLESTALDVGINPALLTALVAQESGFNNKAVSVAKAIGMTQITHIAEEEIKQSVTGWPRYPGIRDLSFMQLKWRVVNDEITPENEWRLDPEKSFIGGSLYIKHILKYWGQPSKKTLIAENNIDLSHAILASYNIGPATVSRAITRKGKSWLSDEEGKTALKYVHMVGSYCTGFTEEKYDET